MLQPETGAGNKKRKLAMALVLVLKHPHVSWFCNVLHMISCAKRIQEAAIDFAVLCKIEAGRALFALTKLTACQFEKPRNHLGPAQRLSGPVQGAIDTIVNFASLTYHISCDVLVTCHSGNIELCITMPMCCHLFLRAVLQT